MKTKSFKDWTEAEVERTFQLHYTVESQTLQQWLITDGETLTDFELLMLERIRKKAFAYVRDWNETELTAKFITAIFDVVDFDQLTYSLFLERFLKGTIEDMTLAGKVDMVIAKGRAEPEFPYFFLQEFKKEKEGANDAVAQLLLAMLVVQVKDNLGKKPLFGGYINGRHWHFVTLENAKYTISESYTATESGDLQEIVKILKKLKKRIEKEIKEAKT